MKFDASVRWRTNENFCESRAGEHARAFLGDWKGSLVCDDYAGYKQSLANGVLEVGCLAHAR